MNAPFPDQETRYVFVKRYAHGGQSVHTFKTLEDARAAMEEATQLFFNGYGPAAGYTIDIYEEEISRVPVDGTTVRRELKPA